MASKLINSSVISEKLSFKAFAKVLDASIQIGQPSILAVGNNDSGKSKLMETVSKKYENSLFVDRVDMGGIRHLIHNGIFNAYRSLNISDMNNIYSRKSEVMQPALAELNNLIDGKISASADYQSVQKFKNIEDFKKAMNIPLKPMNINIGMTPQHLRKISYTTYNDFNTRFVVIEVEREKDFHIEDIDWNEFKKFDRMDNARVTSRKDRWKLALEKISLEYHMDIPVKLWNVKESLWEHIASKALDAINNNGHTALKHKGVKGKK